MQNKCKEECCGCSACADICPQKCIKMEPDSEGFLYPHVDKEKCINCGLCDKVCPFKNDVKDEQVINCLAGYSNNSKVRKNSTSGGIFYHLAESVLRREGVVFGVTLDENEHEVKSIFINSMDDLPQIMGSKYVQANTTAVFKQVKSFVEQGKLVLFSGTPCQVNALCLFMGKDYDNLITVDIICHGVPSQKMFAEYKKWLEKKYGKTLKKTVFRYKDVSWNDYSLKFSFESKKSKVWSKDVDIYMQAFLLNYNLRYSCYNCKAKTTRYADITLGDCWGIEKMSSNFSDVNGGVSTIILRSRKGNDLFSDILSCLTCFPITYDGVKKYNSSECRTVLMPSQRTKFYEDLNNYGIDGINKKYELVTATKRIRRIVYAIKRRLRGI